MPSFETDFRTRAEQLLLSALLKDNGCARHIDRMRIAPRDFSHDLNGQIFRHWVRLMAMDRPADVSSVYESMQRHRVMPRADVLTYLTALGHLPSRPCNAGYYACSMLGPRLAQESP